MILKRLRIYVLGRRGHRLALPAIALASLCGFVLALSACQNPAGPVANADLNGIGTSAGSLFPAFRVDSYSYTLSVPNGTASVSVSAEPEQAGTAVTYSVDQPMSLQAGANPLTITALFSSGETREYTVTVYRNYPSTIIPESDMVAVEGGSFQRDGTVANVSEVSAFRLARTEVTRAQFATVFGSDPSNTPYSTGTGDPVQGVTWYHAIVFCNLLSLAEGRQPVYSIRGFKDPCLWDFNYDAAINMLTYNSEWQNIQADWAANGYRLPTEMEWMWAAIGGAECQLPASLLAYQKNFAGHYGSHVIGDYAWYYDNSDSKTHPAGSAGGTGNANELGLCDMTGNVFEFCWDWRADYPAGTRTDYRGPDSGTTRVQRGGSMFSFATDCKVASRSHMNPSYNSIDVGFRVARN